MLYTRARTRLSACACAGYAYSYAPAQMTERTYVHTYIRTYIRTYIPRIDPDLYCLALMRSAIIRYAGSNFMRKIIIFIIIIINHRQSAQFIVQVILRLIIAFLKQVFTKLR